MSKLSSAPANNAGFAARTKLFLENAARAAQNWYDAEGNWALTSMPAEARERFWICCALYANGMNDLANAIILAGDVTAYRSGDPIPDCYDIFHTNIAAVLLTVHHDKMTPPVRRKLEDLVRGGFNFNPGNRRPDFQFQGINDNMPAKASMGLILGGELLDNPRAVEHGVSNLRQLRNMLFRRGIHSEWNSPTYSPATVSAIAKIAHYAKHPEARELALGIEERLWLDLAARFHPGIGLQSGPYSRAYVVDITGQSSSLSGLLWFVLGDVAKPSPMELFNPDSGLLICHGGDLPFHLTGLCWFATGPYHFSNRALSLFTDKQYPFRATATAEVTSGGPDWPAAPIRIETFLQPDFAVGTSSAQWLDGSQAAPYFVTYKRAPEVKSFKDAGVVYAKFAINDDVPGKIATPTDPNGRPYPHSGEADNLHSRSRVATLQSGPSVLMLTMPHLDLGGLEQQGKAPTPLTRLNEMVIFPSHFKGADEIRVGNESRDAWAGDVARGQWIGCRRGRLLIAVRPLVFLPEPQSVKITLEKINKYEVIRSTFYNGAERVFSRSELANVFGGFVAEHASVDEYDSLASFMADLARSQIMDYYWSNRFTRYRRPASEKRPALEFETSWSPGSAMTRYALIDGRPVSWDTRVSVDGLSDVDFPFLSEPGPSLPFYFPWPKLFADWGTGSKSGYVGDRDEG